MKIEPIKTDIIKEKQDLLALISEQVSDLEEKSILVITSKIVSICEGSVFPIKEKEKKDLIIEQADKFFISKERIFTIKDGFLVSASGIDESNGNENYILWPKNSQKTANKVRRYLQKKFSVSEIGVIITDSRSMPFRRGVVGMALAYSGFSPLKDYRGKKDLFGRKIKFVCSNVVDSLSIAAVMTMGECGEKTPLAKITEIPFVRFKKQNPTAKELKLMNVSQEEDIYAPFYKKIPWKKS